MSTVTRVPQGNYLRRFERSYRATLMYKSGHTALVIWRVLWDYYSQKKLRASPIQVTQELRAAVTIALSDEHVTNPVFNKAVFINGLSTGAIKKFRMGNPT